MSLPIVSSAWNPVLARAWPQARDALEWGRHPPPPASRAPSLRPATVSLTAPNCLSNLLQLPVQPLLRPPLRSPDGQGHRALHTANIMQHTHPCEDTGPPVVTGKEGTQEPSPASCTNISPAVGSYEQVNGRRCGIPVPAVPVPGRDHVADLEQVTNIPEFEMANH